MFLHNIYGSNQYSSVASPCVIIHRMTSVWCFQRDERWYWKRTDWGVTNWQGTDPFPSKSLQVETNPWTVTWNGNNFVSHSSGQTNSMIFQKRKWLLDSQANAERRFHRMIIILHTIPSQPWGLRKMFFWGGQQWITKILINAAAMAIHRRFIKPIMS